MPIIFVSLFDFEFYIIIRNNSFTLIYGLYKLDVIFGQARTISHFRSIETIKIIYTRSMEYSLKHWFRTRKSDEELSRKTQIFVIDIRVGIQLQRSFFRQQTPDKED